MRPLLLAFLTLALLSSCEDDDGAFQPIPMPAFEAGDFKYLALGDSYTIGTSVPEAEQWPRQLLAKLTEEKDIDTDPENNTLDIVAVNGWTTADLISGIEARNDLSARYDLVSLLIGVNNQFQRRGLAEYRTEFTALLESAIDYAGGDKEKVFVVSIPDYAFTPFASGRDGITAGINAFNEAANIIVDSAGVAFYNITDISRDGLADPELVASDDLHPSGKQYARWVEEVLYAPVAVKLEE